MLDSALQKRRMDLDQTLHLATGGTIDSHWDAAKDTAIPNQSSIVPEYFRSALRLALTSRTLFLKDSRDITRGDKNSVVDAVTESTHPRIVVTSGTYLMPDVARKILSPLQQFGSHRRVMVTGSLTPIRGYSASDGGFNLGMSLALLDEPRTEGQVYLVMNGSCFHARDVEKDLTSAQFSSNDGTDLIPYNQWTLITAGGSMDFELDGLDGLRARRSSVVPGFFRDAVRVNKEVTPLAAFIKDSRELDEREVAELVNFIRSSKHEHILMTLGIYNMQAIAKELETRLGEGIGNKKIILTGSRTPLGLSDMSDAPFNLGFALGRMGFVEPGVHVAMNGVVVPRNEDVLKIVYTPEEIDQIKKDMKGPRRRKKA